MKVNMEIYRIKLLLIKHTLPIELIKLSPQLSAFELYVLREITKEIDNG